MTDCTAAGPPQEINNKNKIICSICEQTVPQDWWETCNGVEIVDGSIVCLDCMEQYVTNCLCGENDITFPCRICIGNE
jgi:hypothetical protein